MITILRVDQFLFFILQLLDGFPYPTCLQVNPCLQGPQAGCTVPPMYSVRYWLYGPHVWCSSRAGLQIEMAGLMAASRTQQRSWSLQSLCLSQKAPVMNQHSRDQFKWRVCATWLNKIRFFYQIFSFTCLSRGSPSLAATVDTLRWRTTLAILCAGYVFFQTVDAKKHVAIFYWVFALLVSVAFLRVITWRYHLQKKTRISFNGSCHARLQLFSCWRGLKHLQYDS